MPMWMQTAPQRKRSTGRQASRTKQGAGGSGQQVAARREIGAAESGAGANKSNGNEQPCTGDVAPDDGDVRGVVRQRVVELGRDLAHLRVLTVSTMAMSKFGQMIGQHNGKRQETAVKRSGG